MQSATYQLALVVGLGTFAILLIRGMSLTTALFRSGVVLLVVLALLLVAAGVLRLSIRSSRQNDVEGGPPATADQEEESEPES